MSPQSQTNSLLGIRSNTTDWEFSVTVQSSVDSVPIDGWLSKLTHPRNAEGWIFRCFGAPIITIDLRWTQFSNAASSTTSTVEGMAIASRAHPLNAPFPISLNLEFGENTTLFTFEPANALYLIFSTEEGISTQVKLRHPAKVHLSIMWRVDGRTIETN